MFSRSSRALLIAGMALSGAASAASPIAGQTPPGDPYVDVLVSTKPSAPQNFFMALGIFGGDKFSLTGSDAQSSEVSRFNADGLKTMVDGGPPTTKLAIAAPDGRYRFDLLSFKQTSDGVVQWTGTSADGSGAVAILAIRDGKIIGTINVGGRVIYISPTGLFARHQVGELSVSATSRGEGDADGKAPPPRDGPPISHDVIGQCDGHGSAMAPKATVVRIMVLYSKAAAKASPDIALEAAQLIAEVNQVWSTAHFSVGAELAYVGATDYVEGPHQDADLEALRTGQGKLSTAPSLRDAHRADLVTMITVKGTGAGYTLVHPVGMADYGFSVVNREYARDSKSLAHELGHNLGMDHDRAALGGGLPTSYGYGYVARTAGVRDIMAYPNACPFANCPRVLSYSTPNFIATTASGSEPLGRRITDADAAYNVEALCRNAAVVASFR